MLAGGGHTGLGEGLGVDVDRGSITVTADLTDPAHDPQRIVAALGLAIGAIDPQARPAERADVLSDLGLDIDGANVDAIDHRIHRRGVGYHLSYQPGISLVFAAAVEP